jgi:site-specific recombinase XerD
VGFFQLPIFNRKKFPAAGQQQIISPVTPTGESSVMQTLPAYIANLESNKYSASTTKKYFADIKKFSLFIRDKKIKKITMHDIEQWISGLLSPKGQELDRKTVNRKVSAVINYFLWLQGIGAVTNDPTETLHNTRVLSPLPDYLYENEIKQLYQEASKDPRTYLLVLLFLETGMKSNELFLLTKAHVDISDPFSPEIWIKHTKKETKKEAKKDRKVALPAKFTDVYNRYVAQYKVEDNLFPYTDRFIQLLFADLKKQTKIDKELTPKTLRHTHIFRAYRRGEDPEKIFDRVGYAPDSRKEADEMYSRMARKGI